MHVDFKALLLLQIFLGVIFILLLLVLNVDDESKALPEIVGHVVLLLTACLFFCVAYKEEHFKKYRFLHLLMALTLAFLLVAVDIGLYFWFAKHNETHPTEGGSRYIYVFKFTVPINGIFLLISDGRSRLSCTDRSLHDPGRLQPATDRIPSCGHIDGLDRWDCSCDSVGVVVPNQDLAN